MLTDKTPRPTTMAVAFYLALINRTGKSKVQLLKKVQDSINRNAGLVREREVNASVSYRTAQKLKQQGVL